MRTHVVQPRRSAAVAQQPVSPESHSLPPGRTQDEIDRLQRRTVLTLLGSQVLGGTALVSGYLATSLLAFSLTGSKALAGLSAACLSIGAATASFPLAKMMAARGRRPGLRSGYLLGAFGSFLAVMAAVTGIYAFLPLGVMGIGAGNATNMAARYAAADLARPDRRAQAIGILVWATTVGSASGSLITLSVFNPMGNWLGLPDYAGSYLAGAILFLLAAMLLEARLRPDPLVVAGGVGQDARGGRLPFAAAMGLIMASPQARLAVLGMMISQATMVGTMTLTPLHMDEGGQAKSAISLMMFFHILGMYLLSPVVGRLTDRFGRYPMLMIAGVMCTWGALWAGSTPGDEFFGLAAGQSILGLAWSFGIIAASGLLTESFPVHQRASVQGAGDLCMAVFGAGAGVLAGIMLQYRSYFDLNAGAAILGAILVVAVIATSLAGRGSRAHAGVMELSPAS